MSLHDSEPLVDPEVRAAYLLHLATTFRAFGEELASVGRVMGDRAIREYGERHIGLSEEQFRQACRWGKRAATSGGGAAPGADGATRAGNGALGTDGAPETGAGALGADGAPGRSTGGPQA